MNISEPGRDPLQVPGVRGPEVARPVAPSTGSKARRQTPADLSTLQQLTPEQARDDLQSLLHADSSGLAQVKPGVGALPPGLPRQLGGEAVQHRQVIDESGEEWIETRVGEFCQLSREDGEWTEIMAEDGEWTRQRQCQEPDDGLGLWTEIETPHQHYKIRYRVEDGCTWCEIWRGERYQKTLVRRHDVHDSPA